MQGYDDSTIKDGCTSNLKTSINNTPNQKSNFHKKIISFLFYLRPQIDGTRSSKEKGHQVFFDSPQLLLTYSQFMD